MQSISFYLSVNPSPRQVFLTLNPSPRGEGLKIIIIKFLHPLLPREKGTGDEVLYPREKGKEDEVRDLLFFSILPIQRTTLLHKQHKESELDTIPLLRTGLPKQNLQQSINTSVHKFSWQASMLPQLIRML